MTISSLRTAAWALALALLPLQPAVSAGTGTTTVTWHGHATFEITTPNGKVLVIDPWLKNPMNPKAKDGKDPLAEIKQVDYILITHGHSDHTGDAVALAKKTWAHLVASYELGTNMAKVLGYPKEQMGMDTLMNMGGEITIADGEVMVAMTPAVHSSGLGNPNAGEGQADMVYGGNPVGFVIKIKNGPTIYDSGDTAYFSDMKLIGETYAPDLALINIGGHFGMEPPMAARATLAVRAKAVIPHHYGTFPVLTPNANSFTDALKNKGVRVLAIAPGSSITFEGKNLKTKD